MTIKEIREHAKTYFEGSSPSHDWHHVERVLRLGERIADGEAADEEVVKKGILLHDIGREKEEGDEIEDHAEWGAKEAREILVNLGEDEDLVSGVEHCIRSHRYSNEIEPKTIEAKVVCDADNLDALGAIGIARCFAYGGEMEQTIHDTSIPIEEDNTDMGATQVNHLKKKILTLKERMYTETGEKIAEGRDRYVKDFIERLEEEVEGKK